MKLLIALLASLFAGLIASAALPIPALPTTTATAPLPPPQHLVPRNPPHAALLLPRKGRLTKLVDHILDRLGHRLDKLTSISSDGRVTINAPQCIGIVGIGSACNPVHVGDNNYVEGGGGGWAGRVDGHDGGQGDEAGWWEGSGSRKEWRKAGKEDRKGGGRRKKSKWSGDWGFWEDSDEDSGSGRANADRGDRHVGDQGSSASDSDGKGSHKKEAAEIDWSWGEDSDFQPSKTGWANLGVAGRRRGVGEMGRGGQD